MKISSILIINIFDTVSIPLAALENIFVMLKKAKKKLKNQTHTNILKDRGVEDSITTVLYGLSAITNGDFHKIELAIDTEYSYLKVASDNLGIEINEAVNAWNHLIEKFKEATVMMSLFKDKILRIIADTPDIGEKISEAIKNSNINEDEALIASKLIASNLKKVSYVSIVLEDTQKLYLELEKTIHELPSKLDPEGRQKIHTVGKQAYKSNVKSLREIIIRFWPEKHRVVLRSKRIRRSKLANLR